jgi:hypothetical protein
MPTKPTTTRKSISMPRDLATVIEDRARTEHRSFAKQVSKIVADFFASEGVIHLTKPKHESGR